MSSLKVEHTLTNKVHRSVEVCHICRPTGVVMERDRGRSIVPKLDEETDFFHFKI
jgi:hypothetical protein